MSEQISREGQTLICSNCKARARDNSKERGRFLRRHGKACLNPKDRTYTLNLSLGTRSVPDSDLKESE